MKFHPVCDLFPEMPSDEFDDLVSDIREHGVLVPVVVYDDQIIDGKHRWKACKIVGIECPARAWKPKENESVVAYAIGLNAKRRHLTPSQLAVLAVDALPLFEAESAERMRRGTLPPIGGRVGRSAKLAAKSFGTSERSVQRLKAVKEAAPEKFEQVRRKEKTVAAAEAEVKKAKTPPPSRPKDGRGKAIDDQDVIDALAAASAFDELRADLLACLRKAKAIDNGPGAQHYHDQEVESLIRQAADYCQLDKPTHQCPLMPNCLDGKCKYCKGSKYVTKSIFERVPKELHG